MGITYRLPPQDNSKTVAVALRQPERGSYAGKLSRSAATRMRGGKGDRRQQPCKAGRTMAVYAVDHRRRVASLRGDDVRAKGLAPNSHIAGRLPTGIVEGQFTFPFLVGKPVPAWASNRPP